jgi:hypothetical protein
MLTLFTDAAKAIAGTLSIARLGHFGDELERVEDQRPTSELLESAAWHLDYHGCGLVDELRERAEMFRVVEDEEK